MRLKNNVAYLGVFSYHCSAEQIFNLILQNYIYVLLSEESEWHSTCICYSDSPNDCLSWDSRGLHGALWSWDSPAVEMRLTSDLRGVVCAKFQLWAEPSSLEHYGVEIHHCWCGSEKPANFLWIPLLFTCYFWWWCHAQWFLLVEAHTCMEEVVACRAGSWQAELRGGHWSISALRAKFHHHSVVSDYQKKSQSMSGYFLN